MGVGMPSPRSLLGGGYPWYQVPSGWVYQGIYQEVYQGWGGYTRYTHPTPPLVYPPPVYPPQYTQPQCTWYRRINSCHLLEPIWRIFVVHYHCRLWEIFIFYNNNNIYLSLGLQFSSSLPHANVMSFVVTCTQVKDMP